MGMKTVTRKKSVKTVSQSVSLKKRKMENDKAYYIILRNLRSLRNLSKGSKK